MPESIILSCIMKFVDRQEELARLDRFAAGDEGGLAVVYGRRRVGKTRLLLEWEKKHGGLYTVADQSVAELQRRYFAEALDGVLPGFSEVEYRDWRSLLARVAREAQLAGWRGPLIFDEFPYLALASPELPSVLQRWIDHEAPAARLRMAIAGSSQRMMQGFVLSGDAPLFGRAKEILEIQPLQPVHLPEVFDVPDGVRWAELYAAWGGIPRYWELAQDAGGDVASQIDRLVLDPLGPLHREPDRLLLEEIPSALETRPLLDAIGAGAHRVSEIAERLGRPATSMARPLDRLVSLGLVRRELPFGEDEKASKARSLQDRRSVLSSLVPRRGATPGAARERRACLSPAAPRPLLGEPLHSSLGGSVPAADAAAARRGISGEIRPLGSGVTLVARYATGVGSGQRVPRWRTGPAGRGEVERPSRRPQDARAGPAGAGRQARSAPAVAAGGR
jgi:AAA+ ATPase superfamily predicted ATPase